MSNLPEVLSVKEYEFLLADREINENSYCSSWLILGFDKEIIQKENSSLITDVFIRQDLLTTKVKDGKAPEIEKIIRTILAVAKNEIAKKGLVVIKVGTNSFPIKSLDSLDKLYKVTNIKEIQTELEMLLPYNKLLPTCIDNNLPAIIESIKKAKQNVNSILNSNEESASITAVKQTRLFVRAARLLEAYEKEEFTYIAFKAFAIMNTLIHYFIKDYDDELMRLRPKGKVKDSLGRPRDTEKKMMFGKIYQEAYNNNKVGAHADRRAGIKAAREAYNKYATENNNDPKNKKMKPDCSDETYVDWGNYYHRSSLKPS